MYMFKRIAITINVLVLVSCGGAQTPSNGTPSNTQSNKPPTIVSGQLLADGSVYITSVNTAAPAKSTLLADGSVYVVTNKK